MKKFFFLVLGIVGFALVPHVFAATTAAQFVPLAPIPNLTDSTAATQLLSGSFAQFFNNLYKYLIGVAVIIAVGLIIWSGIQIAMNKDSVSKTLASRGRINNAIFGLILVLAPALVFAIINPSILNLKIDIDKVDLTSTPYQPQDGHGLDDTTNTQYPSGEFDRSHTVCAKSSSGSNVSYNCAQQISACRNKAVSASATVGCYDSATKILASTSDMILSTYTPGIFFCEKGPNRATLSTSDYVVAVECLVFTPSGSRL